MSSFFRLNRQMVFVTGRYIMGPGARGKTVRMRCLRSRLKRVGGAFGEWERRRVDFMFDVLVSLAFGGLLTSSSSLVSVYLSAGMAIILSESLYVCL